MKATENFGLQLPEMNEFVSPEPFNANFETLDGTLAKHAARHAAGGEDPLTLSDIGAAEAGHTHTVDDVKSGTFGVTRGGTGKSSFTANRLIYPSAATTLAQLGFPSVAGSVLRQGTSGAPYWTSLSDLMSALSGLGGAKIAQGTYVGTGTYKSDNPTILTFDFVPKFVFISENHYSQGELFLIKGMTQAMNANGNSSSDYVTVSWTGTTVSFYATGSPGYQCNSSSTRYYYVAMG